MKHVSVTDARPVPVSRDARAVVATAEASRRRRATCAAGCVAALVIALALPTSARAGWPLESAARCTLAFGATYSASDGAPSTHRGVDLEAAEGSAVRAPIDGHVSFAGRVPGTGGGTVLAVTVATTEGSLTLMPLSLAAVKAGADLSEGDVVGTLAGLGDASSRESHLHVGARKGDLYVDPLTWLSAPAAVTEDSPRVSQPVPTAQAQPAAVPGVVAVSPAAQGIARAGGVSAATVSAMQPSAAVAGAVVGVGAPAAAVAPGVSIAPGVSAASAVDGAALQSSPMQAASAALSAAVRGVGGDRSREGAPGGALIEWALGLAARGLQTGARVLAGVLLALGALWPIWRSERRKGAGQLSVRPSSDDVAAVTGR